MYPSQGWHKPNISAAGQITPPPDTGLLSWPALFLLGFTSYDAALCSLLRFRRIEDVRSPYPYAARASLARMANQDIPEIAKSPTSLKFPLFYDLSVRLALFKVRKIPRELLFQVVWLTCI